MSFSFGPLSRQRLQGVDPELVRVVERALQLSPVDFMVSEGLRTRARQAELYAKGRTTPGPKVTWTMNSKHITGDAVDLVPWVGGKADWNTLANFKTLSKAMSAAAKELGIAIRYGGDWDGDGVQEKGEADLVHWELR